MPDIDSDSYRKSFRFPCRAVGFDAIVAGCDSIRAEIATAFGRPGTRCGGCRGTPMVEWYRESLQLRPPVLVRPMASSHVARAAAALPPNPSQEEILATAEVIGLAACESAADVPGRAVTQYVRHHFGAWTPELRAELRRRALSIVEREGEAASRAGPCRTAEAPTPAYYSFVVAALRLGVSEKRLRQMLRYPQYRRALGWPRCWDGTHWHILISAVDHPETVAGLPPVEPPHNLPGWCLRVEDVADMNSFPELG